MCFLFILLIFLMNSSFMQSMEQEESDSENLSMMSESSSSSEGSGIYGRSIDSTVPYIAVNGVKKIGGFLPTHTTSAPGSAHSLIPESPRARRERTTRERVDELSLMQKEEMDQFRKSLIKDLKTDFERWPRSKYYCYLALWTLGTAAAPLALGLTQLFSDDYSHWVHSWICGK